MSLRDQLEAITKCKATPIQVEEWAPLTVYAKVLTWKEAIDYQAELNNVDGQKRFDHFNFPRLIARIMCDENGTLLYDPESDDDLLKLGERSKTSLLEFFNKAISDSPVENAKKKLEECPRLAFAFDLAAHLKKSVTWCFENIPSWEWDYWQARSEQYPFDDSWFLAMVLKSSIYHAAGHKWVDPLAALKRGKRTQSKEEMAKQIASLERTLKRSKKKKPD